MYEQTLTGNAYVVRVKIWAKSGTGWSAGDHYADGGEYTYYYVAGDVCIYDKETGRPIFACSLTTDSGRLSTKPSDACLGRYVEVEDVLPDRQTAYADWLAEKWIKRFGEFDQSKGIPRIILDVPDCAELVQRGIVADRNGQASLPLYDLVGRKS
jgi:hypothetical protein